jgi:signal transduction histidine kinase
MSERDVDAARRLAAEWASEFAHEARTPLTVLRGYASLLPHVLASADEATLRAGLEAIERNVRRLDAIISGSCALESGKLELRRELLDMGELAQAVLSDFEPLRGEHEVRLECGEPCAVYADEARIEQVLVNLLANALKFSPSSGRIDVRVSRQAAQVEVEVRDEGPGIPLDRRDAVFERGRTLLGEASGDGLGLFLSRQLARAHHGDVVAGDQTGGCSMVLRLPVANELALG